jgi:hypothetical protein
MSRTSRIRRRAVASASVTVLSDNAATFVAGTQNNNVSSRPRTTARS